MKSSRRLSTPPTTRPMLKREPEDRWEGYVTQRAELQAFVDAHELRDILWITGDVHMCWVGQVEGNPVTPGESMWEVCVTSGNINTLAEELPEDQFPWRSPAPHLPLITFDPEHDRVRVEFFNQFGSLVHTQDFLVGADHADGNLQVGRRSLQPPIYPKNKLSRWA